MRDVILIKVVLIQIISHPIYYKELSQLVPTKVNNEIMGTIGGHSFLDLCLHSQTTRARYGLGILCMEL